MVKIVIEELNLLGHVTKLHTFDRFPISIGRGYDNDLILLDAHVSPIHLELDECKEGWQVKDLNSENGTVIKHRSKSTEANQLISGDDIVIGRTKLRLLLPSHPVSKTRSLAKSDDVVKKLARPVVAIPIFILAIFLLILDVQLQITSKSSVTKILTGALPLFLFSLFWAGGWAFVSRVIKHKANFQLQFVLALLFSIASVGITDTNSYINYISSSQLAGNITENLLSGLAFAGLLYFNLRNSTNTSKKTSIMTAHTISWTLIALSIVLQQSEQPDFNYNATFASELKPPIFHIGQSQTLPEFLEDSVLTFEQTK